MYQKVENFIEVHPRNILNFDVISELYCFFSGEGEGSKTKVFHENVLRIFQKLNFLGNGCSANFRRSRLVVFSCSFPDASISLGN